MQFSKPYESAALRKAIGPALRPGGLELTERAARFCGLAPESQVLDVGCGIGATVAFLQDRFRVAAVGIDASTLLLAEAREDRPTLPLVRGDGACLPFASGLFSVLFCECTLSLLEDRTIALTEFYRVLRPHGHLVVADLYWRSSGLPDTGSHLTARGCLAGALPRHQLERQIEDAGFTLDIWEDHSEHLKRLAAKLVWDGIRVADLWGAACRPGPGATGRPGYGLLVSHKRREPYG
jgi:arsenite methyltransferase